MKIKNLIFFTNVYNNLKTQIIPISLAYKLNKICNFATEELKFFEEEKQKLMLQYFNEDENKALSFKNDNEQDEFNKKFNELLETEVVETNITLKLEELKDLKIKLEDYQILDYWIEKNEL